MKPQFQFLLKLTFSFFKNKKNYSVNCHTRDNNENMTIQKDNFEKLIKDKQKRNKMHINKRKNKGNYYFSSLLK